MPCSLTAKRCFCSVEEVVRVETTYCVMKGKIQQEMHRENKLRGQTERTRQLDSRKKEDSDQGTYCSVRRPMRLCMHDSLDEGETTSLPFFLCWKCVCSRFCSLFYLDSFLHFCREGHDSCHVSLSSLMTFPHVVVWETQVNEKGQTVYLYICKWLLQNLRGERSSSLFLHRLQNVCHRDLSSCRRTLKRRKPLYNIPSLADHPPFCQF